MLALEAAQDGGFAGEASADLGVAGEVLVNDLEGDAFVVADAARVVDDARAALAEDAEDLELVAELSARREGRQLRQITAGAWSRLGRHVSGFAGA